MEKTETGPLNDKDDVDVDTDEPKPKDFPLKGPLITDEKAKHHKMGLANDRTVTDEEKLDNRSTSKLSKTNVDQSPVQNGNSDENCHLKEHPPLLILDTLENSTCSQNGSSLKAVHEGLTNIIIEENSNMELTDPLCAEEGEGEKADIPTVEDQSQRISVVRISQNGDVENSNSDSASADALPNGADHSHCLTASSSSSCRAKHDDLQQSVQPQLSLQQQPQPRCPAAPSLTTTLVSDGISYVRYENESQMPDIMRLITKDLSEPYSIYTYRYFIHNWPKLCFLAMDEDKCVGAIVCKLDVHKKMANRGYIAMLAVDTNYRRRRIGSTLVRKAIRAMILDEASSCDEVVLETEITNTSALRLYENLGFVRDKRLFRYYLNGVDALRLKLWLR